MSKLALLGGTPEINLAAKHFSWPVIDKQIEERVIQQIRTDISIYDRSGIIESLEESFCKFLNSKHALLTNSGTNALYSMFVGANLHEGDEIICPAYTFFATVSPLFMMGVVPVLVDSRDDGNIDPQKIEKAINKKTKGIIVTHMWGYPCEMQTIAQIAQKNNLMLFEDASHAHGATYNGKQVGTFGVASAFSIQGQKTITGGEGGVLITNDDEIFYRALLLGHYNKRCKKEIPSSHYLYEYSTTGMGLKFRIHPVAAAIAQVYLERIDEIIDGRNKIAEIITNGLTELPGLKLPLVPQNITHSWYAYNLQYKSEELDNLPIDVLFKALQAEGCCELDRPGSTSPLNYHAMFQNPHKLFPFYKNKMNYKIGDFPIAEEYHENSLKLPVWHTDSDIEITTKYVDAFEKVISNYKELLSYRPRE